MSLIQMSFFSEALNRMTSANIILPTPRRASAPLRDVPVLYLLHGMGDDHTAWLRKTDVERYALDAGLAVVMPDGGLSCYENMAHGERFRDHMENELPALMRACFPISDAREKSFIAGCSMGGHGALKMALRHPERYCAVGCFSGAHLEYRPDARTNREMLARVYDDGLEAADARVIADARRVRDGACPLLIYHSCGDDDLLLESALQTRSFFGALSGGAIDYRFELLPGRHDWRQWDAALEKFIAALDLPAPAERCM